MAARPKLAIWKFSSCDGCQLTLLDCEDELLAVVGAVEVCYFPEATRAVVPGPYDLSLIEGSVTTPREAEHVKAIRAMSKTVVAIGACATAGGIQALKNLHDVDDFIAAVYATPSFIDTLDTATPISDHIKVDFELRGCPVSKGQLLEVLSAFLHDRPAQIPRQSVCVECKLRGTICVMVAHGTPCLGPITHGGCNALCPAYDRGCYGCFGPVDGANVPALDAWWGELGVSKLDRQRALRTFNVQAAPLREVSERHDEDDTDDQG